MEGKMEKVKYLEVFKTKIHVQSNKKHSEKNSTGKKTLKQELKLQQLKRTH